MKTTQQIISSLQAGQLIEDARRQLESGSYYEALHCINAYLLFQHHDEHAFLIKGLCYLYTQQPDKARYMFDLVLNENPNNAEVYYCYAEYYKLEMEYDSALSYINAAMASGDENATYHRLAAEICYLSGDLDEGFRQINRAIIVQPFREDLYFWRALFLVKMDREDIARNDLNRSISLNPHNPAAYRLRSTIHMHMGRVDHALTDLKKAQQYELLQQHACGFAA